MERVMEMVKHINMIVLPFQNILLESLVHH